MKTKFITPSLYAKPHVKENMVKVKITRPIGERFLWFLPNKSLTVSPSLTRGLNTGLDLIRTYKFNQNFIKIAKTDLAKLFDLLFDLTF